MIKRLSTAAYALCEVRWLLPALLCVASGCASVSAADAAMDAKDCAKVLQWERARSGAASRIAGESTSDEGGRRYDFDLNGRGGLTSLRADCGAGSYAECTFHATRTSGEKLAFSELSTFSLWEWDSALYLVYRIVDPKTPSDRAKRRLVKVGDPPMQICNEIGDYSNLM